MPPSSARGGLRALYICYLSLDDPLVHSQVVAYLAGLVTKGHTVHLLTFDGPLDAARRQEFATRLAAQGIVWHSLRYHKRPSLPATIFDTLRGAVVAAKLVRQHRLDAVHARNHVPMAAALLVRRLTGCRLIFDIRGLMAEEYVDAGRWSEGGIPFRITHRVQRAGIDRSDGIVTLTNAVRPYLFGPNGRRNAHVIPCCADLEQLESRLEERNSAREELGLGDARVMIYVGKFTGWYMEREMVDFFAVARRLEPNLRFLILTQLDRGLIEAEFRRARIAESAFFATRAEPGEVGRYLAAADFGVSFIRRCFSKISSSPTKIAEYLGAGLPVVSTAGIGDVDPLLRVERVGVLVEEFTPAAYERAARSVLDLLGDPTAAERCRSAAHRHLSLRDVGIPRYDRLYRGVGSR